MTFAGARGGTTMHWHEVAALPVAESGLLGHHHMDGMEEMDAGHADHETSAEG